MERGQLDDTINRLQKERDRHAKRFAGCEAHTNCIDKLDHMLLELRKQESQQWSRDADNYSHISAKGDELAQAGELNKLFHFYEGTLHEDQARSVKNQLYSMVSKELNELDGFDR